MASSLSHLLTKPVVSFCLGAAAVVSYSYFCNGSKDESIIEVDSYRSIICDFINTSLTCVVDSFICPTSIPKKLACILNSMDSGLNVKSRWDAMEDDRALYLLRDMSGLHKKDVRQFVEFPNGYNRSVDYRINVLGKVRVYRVKQYKSAILAIKHVGFQPEGGDPHTPYRGYTIKIDLPSTYYKASDVKIDDKDNVLKITIPKKQGNRLFDKISGHTDFNLFWPDNN